MKNRNTGASLPAVVGLVAGIALLVTLSIAFAGPTSAIGRVDNGMKVSLEGLKSTYGSSEPITFGVVARGVSSTWCNDTVPSVTIVDSDGRSVWSSNPFSTAILCSESRPIESEWLFGNEGSANSANDGDISISQAGLYKAVASYEDATAEEEFLITSMDQDIQLTFQGLKSEYGPGEHITFSVKAEGISEAACNNNVPSVSIKDDSSRPVWSSKLVLNRMLLCEPEHIDKQWQFGNQIATHSAENGIMTIDRAGSYTVTVTYDMVSVAKKITIQ